MKTREGWLRILMVTALACALAGCHRQAPRPTTAAGNGRAAEAGEHYEVHGVIERLPETTGPDHSLYIHHEPIPDFRDQSGAVVGMNSMIMPFPVADGVSLDGIAAGDTVAFTLEVNWNASPAYRVTSIQKLPPGTTIHFAAKP